MILRHPQERIEEEGLTRWMVNNGTRSSLL